MQAAAHVLQIFHPYRLTEPPIVTGMTLYKCYKYVTRIV
jgi:hypothetical protein